MEDIKTKLKLCAPAHGAGNACSRVMTSPRFAPVVLVIILIWEFWALICKAPEKFFWYDELFTYHLSSLQPFSLFWTALKAGADATPLGYFEIIRAARMLPGDPHLTLRLPSILGYLLTLVGVYWFARKKLPGFAGLSAVILITLSPFRAYALEARSYSLLVGFFAISAVLWQRIEKKWFMTLLLAAFLTLAVSCHALAVVALSCFGLAELAWTVLSRRIRWGVWAACLLATSPFFISLPILLSFRDVFAKNSWSPATWGMAISTYDDYLGLNYKFPFVLILFLGLVFGDSLLRMMRRPREAMGQREPDLPEIILVSGLLYYPVLLVMLTTILGSSYTSRYGWPAILGLAWGSMYLLRTLWRKPSSAYLVVALLIAFVSQCGIEFRKTKVDQRWTRLAELSRTEPGIPVVISSPMEYLQAAEYSPPELRGRLLDVIDPDMAARLIGSNTADKATRIIAQFVPLHVEDLAAFQAAHQKFLLRSVNSYDWVTPYFVESKYHMTLLAKDGGSSLYIVER